MDEVCLIRPGCTDFDEQRRIQGSLDLPLNPRGREQVERVIEHLRGRPLEVIYTSASEPARATAEEIGESLDVPVKELDDLRNLDQGLWQGLQLDDIRRKFPKVYKQWKESPESICPPNGETVKEAVDRVRRALRKPLKRRSPFAVVASEPLATLVRCVVEDCQSHTPGPICGETDQERLEILHIGGETAGGEARSREARNGKPRSEKANHGEARPEPRNQNPHDPVPAPADGDC